MNNLFGKPPIYLAIVWLAVKILIFNLYPATDSFLIGVGLNMVFILLIILLQLRSAISIDSFILQLKSVLKPVVLYIVLSGVGIYTYYSQVDLENIKNKIALSRQGLYEEIEKQGGFEAFKEKNPGIKEKNMEEFIKKKNESIPSFLTAQGQALFSVMSMLMLSTILTLIFIVVSRSVLKKGPHQTVSNNSAANSA